MREVLLFLYSLYSGVFFFSVFYSFLFIGFRFDRCSELVGTSVWICKVVLTVGRSSGGLLFENQ